MSCGKTPAVCGALLPGSGCHQDPASQAASEARHARDPGLWRSRSERWPRPSCRVERHLSDERRTAADDGLDRASESFAIKDQLIKIVCTTWDLSDHPVTDGGADGSDIHLQKEVAEGGIRGWALELDRKRLSEHIVMTPGKTLQIAGALEFS